jgi:2-amino-4-hydroxy-6-hydroxymethyldihydropteridine diphosphokinase
LPLNELAADLGQRSHEWRVVGLGRTMEDEYEWAGHQSARVYGRRGRRTLSKRVRAYVGLGANVGDARANLQRAVPALSALPGVRLRAVSPLYQTKPVGVLDQPDFLNAVVALDVPAGPDPATGALAFLSALKQIERALGRQKRERWGPREIDLDLLVFGRHQIDAPTLTVPHPRMRERLFVLAPLADVAAGLRPPGWKATVKSVRSALDSGDVEQLAAWET